MVIEFEVLCGESSESWSMWPVVVFWVSRVMAQSLGVWKGRGAGAGARNAVNSVSSGFKALVGLLDVGSGRRRGCQGPLLSAVMVQVEVDGVGVAQGGGLMRDR